MPVVYQIAQAESQKLPPGAPQSPNPHRGSGRRQLSSLSSSEKLDLAISLENNYFLIKGLSPQEARGITSFVYNSTLPADQLENQLRTRSGEKLESISTLPPGAQPVPNLSRNVGTLNAGLPPSEQLRSPALSI
jgi:hypothetical protein